MEIVTRLRKWGNSFGVVIPREVVSKRDLKENEELVIKIDKKKSMRELFGSLRGNKLDAQKIKDEIRREEASAG